MYRSFVLLAPKRLTYGKKWKHLRILNSLKNKTQYNPYLIITQCDTKEKIIKMQKLIDKQTKLIDKKNNPEEFN